MSCCVYTAWTQQQAEGLQFRPLELSHPRRYSALKSLGEKKACFNEYTQQRKKDEVLERRLALKKAREDFNTMLEECAELSTGLRLSKAAQILEDDPRWKVWSASML